MSKQQRFTFILLGVLVLLFGIWGYYYYTTQADQKIQIANRQLLQNFSSSSVTALEITKNNTTVRLEKNSTSNQDGSWVIASQNSTPADPAAVQEALSFLSGAVIQNVVSQQGNETERYGFIADTQVQVVAYNDSSVLADIMIGNTGSVPYTMYVKRNAESAVYLINGSSTAIDRDSWIAEAPLEENANDTSEIE